MLGGKGNMTTSSSPDALSARYNMSDDSNKSSAKKGFDPAGTRPALFRPDEIDIYCNKVTVEAFIFHGKPLDYTILDHLEYDHKHHTVDVILKDKKRLDLGVKIEWVVRPYFGRAQEVNIVQTQNGQSLAGVVLPLKHKNDKKQ
jgi:hypothetical protein